MVGPSVNREVIISEASRRKSAVWYRAVSGIAGRWVLRKGGEPGGGDEGLVGGEEGGDLGPEGRGGGCRG